MGINLLVGVKSFNHLSDIILNKSYTKRSDIKFLKNAGYSDSKANDYMNGYVECIGDILSYIYPGVKWEEYINTVNRNVVVMPEIEIHPGDILLSHKASCPNNLSIVYEIGKDAAQNGKIFITNLFGLITKKETELFAENSLKLLPVKVETFGSLYEEELYINYRTSFVNTFKYNNIDQVNFSVIGNIGSASLNELNKVYEEYRKEMETLYDKCISEGKREDSEV